MADLIDREELKANIAQKLFDGTDRSGDELADMIAGCIDDAEAASEVPNLIIQTEHLTFGNTEGEFHVSVVEQTAEEMFRELGYIPAPLKDAHSGCAVALFEKDNGDHEYEIEVVAGVPGGEVAIEFRMDGRTGPALSSEIKALARLIEELEAGHGKT